MKTILLLLSILLTTCSKAQKLDTMQFKIAVILDVSDTSRYATGLKAGKLRNKTRTTMDGFMVLSASKDTSDQNVKFVTWLDEMGLPLNKKYKVWNNCDRE